MYPPMTQPSNFEATKPNCQVFEKKNKSQVRISIFSELAYKEKRKRNLCAFVKFYGSAQKGSILSSTRVPDP